MELIEKEKKGFKKTEVGIIPSDWKVMELGALIKLKNGYSFSSNYFSNKGPIVLTPGNFNLRGGLYFNERNTKHYSGTFPKEYKFEQGDLLVVMTDLTPDCNLLGKPAFVTESDLLHNQRIGKLIVDEKRVSKNYLYWLLLSARYAKWMKETAVGSTVRHTSPTNIYKTIVSLPPTLEEQKAIATALSETDALIAGLEKLITKKKAIKQGAMQQLLTPPSKGGKRLPGFSGKWEEKRLGDILEVITDYTANGSFGALKENVRYFSSENFAVLVRTTDLDKVKFIPERFTNKVGYNFLGKTALYGNEIIMANVGSIGKVFRVPSYSKPMTLAPNTYLLKYKKDISEDYMFQWMTTPEFKSKLMEKVGSTTLLAINKDNLRDINCHIPLDLEEQNTIARILNEMDKEIEALESKKAKYEQLKQGMMQELLTGKTRLV